MAAYPALLVSGSVSLSGRELGSRLQMRAYPCVCRASFQAAPSLGRDPRFLNHHWGLGLKNIKSIRPPRLPAKLSKYVNTMTCFVSSPWERFFLIADQTLHRLYQYWPSASHSRRLYVYITFSGAIPAHPFALGKRDTLCHETGVV